MFGLQTVMPIGVQRQGETERLAAAHERRSDIRGPLILVVDESAMCCELLGSALTLPGYRVRDVPDGVAARRVIQQADDPVAVVLLDLSSSSQAAADLNRLRSIGQAPPGGILRCV